jgi:hypothetical protein
MQAMRLVFMVSCVHYTSWVSPVYVAGGALFRTHLPCRRGHQDYSRQTDHLHIATLNTTSLYISDGLQATTNCAATAMPNISFGNIVVL